MSYSCVSSNRNSKPVVGESEAGAAFAFLFELRVLGLLIVGVDANFGADDHTSASLITGVQESSTACFMLSSNFLFLWERELYIPAVNDGDVRDSDN